MRPPRPGLEFKGGAQVYCTAIVNYLAARASAPVPWTIHDTERGAKNIRVGNAPAWMVQKVIERGEQFEALSFPDTNVLDNRCVPGKRVSIANEKNLTETTGRPVRLDEGWVGSAVRANQALIDRQKLRGRRSRSVESSQWDSLRVKHFLNLL